MQSPLIKLRPKVKVEHELQSVEPIIQDIYLSRGITHTNELDYELRQLPTPDLMKSNLEAGKILSEAIRNDKKLLIVADFDVDGATSCSLMMLALKVMGAQHVDYLVPDRFKYGYGLTPGIVELAAEKKPDLIITVDNGIASIDGVNRAKEFNIDVLITDHHLPGDDLPDALVIVNPNQQDCQFPSKALAGVGVAFYVMMATRIALREVNWFEKRQIAEPNLAQFLDLVALGTVADIVPLEYPNRILVTQGLKRIRAGLCRPGILALLNIAKKNHALIQSSDLGFAVGPRLNAAGRLDDMSLGIECLLTENSEQADALSRELDTLNRARRDIESTMQQQALDIVEGLRISNVDQATALCLYQSDWHQGVIGLLASRIKDSQFCPVIAFADADTDPDSLSDELKGSARSIPGIHIRDTLDQVATRHPDLLQKFGGHAMAAGLSIKKQHFNAFKDAFYQEVKRALGDRELENILWSDGELSHDMISRSFAETIRAAGPWGQAFDEPKFHGEFLVLNKRILGDKHLKLQLKNNNGSYFDAIAFFQDKAILDANLEQIKILYKVDINFFRDQENLQLLIEQLEVL